MTGTTNEKLQKLKQILADTGGCAIAFSGGVDSSLLVTVAHEVLGERMLAVIATSSIYPERECKWALDFVQSRNIPHIVVDSEELDIPGYSANPRNRCYYCKRELFEKVWAQAKAHGLPRVADGSNADDAHDYRPGLEAAREFEVISPHRMAGLTKQDIRTIARENYHLDVADKPAMACLASRFPYGFEITRDKLGQIERMEIFLEQNGFRIYRARHHGDVLRLELGADEMASVFADGLRERIVATAKSLGFLYITLDLEGYRSGSMNETLIPQKRDETG